MDISGIRDEAEAYDRKYAILGGEWSPFWHDVIDLVGMERLYYLFFDNPAVVDLIMEKVTEYYYEVSRRTFEIAGDCIDIFFIGNDFGSQNGALTSPQQFRRFILPHLKTLIDLGHAYSRPVMLHCCGGIRELMPIMIDAGLDGIHALQPDTFGMDPLGIKRDFGNDIVLNGAMDSHAILIDGASPEFVRQKTREILEIMAPGGNYIAGPSHDYVLPETPLENVLAMFDAIEEFGAYG